METVYPITDFLYLCWFCLRPLFCWHQVCSCCRGLTETQGVDFLRDTRRMQHPYVATLSLNGIDWRSSLPYCGGAVNGGMQASLLHIDLQLSPRAYQQANFAARSSPINLSPRRQSPVGRTSPVPSKPPVPSPMKPTSSPSKPLGRTSPVPSPMKPTSSPNQPLDIHSTVEVSKGQKGSHQNLQVDLDFHFFQDVDEIELGRNRALEEDFLKTPQVGFAAAPEGVKTPGTSPTKHRNMQSMVHTGGSMRPDPGRQKAMEQQQHPKPHAHGSGHANLRKQADMVHPRNNFPENWRQQLAAGAGAMGGVGAGGKVTKMTPSRPISYQTPSRPICSNTSSRPISPLSVFNNSLVPSLNLNPAVTSVRNVSPPRNIVQVSPRSPSPTLRKSVSPPARRQLSPSPLQENNHPERNEIVAPSANRPIQRSSPPSRSAQRSHPPSASSEYASSSLNAQPQVIQTSSPRTNKLSPRVIPFKAVVSSPVSSPPAPESMHHKPLSAPPPPERPTRWSPLNFTSLVDERPAETPRTMANWMSSPIERYAPITQLQHVEAVGVLGAALDLASSESPQDSRNRKRNGKATKEEVDDLKYTKQLQQTVKSGEERERLMLDWLLSKYSQMC